MFCPLPGDLTPNGSPPTVILFYTNLCHKGWAPSISFLCNIPLAGGLNECWGGRNCGLYLSWSTHFLLSASCIIFSSQDITPSSYRLQDGWFVALGFFFFLLVQCSFPSVKSCCCCLTWHNGICKKTHFAVVAGPNQNAGLNTSVHHSSRKRQDFVGLTLSDLEFTP